MMDIVTYIELSAATVATYGIAVAAALFVLRRCGDGTADEVSDAARAAFRRWFRFAN